MENMENMTDDEEDSSENDGNHMATNKRLINELETKLPFSGVVGGKGGNNINANNPRGMNEAEELNYVHE